MLACILALALPLQAAAMVYVQTATSMPQASAPHAQHVHAHAQGDHHGMDADGSTQHPCDEPGDGALKCCHTHAAWLDTRVTTVVPLAPSFERRPFACRWTNFIPEEPSPPPIARS
jgi:hypothetical protein